MRVEYIGDATLYLGDCREIAPSLIADALVTDPPYGINAARDRHSERWGWRDYPNPGWDRERPGGDLLRLVISSAQNAIVWGGNISPMYIRRAISGLSGIRAKRTFRWRIANLPGAHFLVLCGG
jgi:hypothetical protein